MLKPFSLVVFVCIAQLGIAQPDTLKLRISEADSLFLVNSYQLLAASLNIDAQQAQVIQAKLFPNPIFTADLNAYSSSSPTPFNIGRAGQKGFQLEQLIRLGGKRKEEIELAKSDVKIAELEFQEILRQLKFQLHTSLHALNQQKTLLKNYNTQLALLDTLLKAYDEQVLKGNLPLKDLVRLKGVYLNLNNDKAELLKDYLEEMTKVQTILQSDKFILPIITESDIATAIKDKSLADLQAETLVNRADYLIAKEYESAANTNLRLQKKNAIPDVNFFTYYDQRGGAFANQFNVGVAVPLPLWNRNQGNIKTANIRVEQSGYFELAKKFELLTEVQNNFYLYQETVREYNKSKELYNADFELTLKGVSDNFLRRNISIIEFIDFFEGYNQAVAEIARIKIQLATSAEQLNLTIGKEIF